MMFIERDGMDFTNEEDSHIQHDMDRKTMEYVCEDCDYRWVAQMNVEFNENYNGENAPFTVDDTKVTCPMCGSNNCSRV